MDTEMPRAGAFKGEHAAQLLRVPQLLSPLPTHFRDSLCYKKPNSQGNLYLRTDYKGNQGRVTVTGHLPPGFPRLSRLHGRLTSLSSQPCSFPLPSLFPGYLLTNKCTLYSVSKSVLEKPNLLEGWSWPTRTPKIYWLRHWVNPNITATTHHSH